MHIIRCMVPHAERMVHHSEHMVLTSSRKHMVHFFRAHGWRGDLEVHGSQHCALGGAALVAAGLLHSEEQPFVVELGAS